MRDTYVEGDFNRFFFTNFDGEQISTDNQLAAQGRPAAIEPQTVEQYG